MSHRLKVIAITFSLLAFELQAVEQTVHDDLTKLLARVEHSSFDPNYGTLMLFHNSGRSLYYLINSHAVPYKAATEGVVRIISGALGDVPVEATIVANEAGSDLAVVRVRLPKENPELAAELTLLRQRFYQREDHDNQFKHVAVVGSAGRQMNNELAYKNLTSRTEIELNDYADELRTNIYSTYYFLGKEDIQEKPQNLSYDQVKLTVTKSDCPPLNLRECYIIPVETSGFSGGPLLASDHPSFDRSTLIAGMVSYFIPGMRKTIVIPIGIAIDTGLQLIGERAIEEDNDLRELPLTFIKAGCYRFRYGDLQPKVLRLPGVEACDEDNHAFHPSISTGGGGTGMGGGGTGMGGGGTGMGGGGNSHDEEVDFAQPPQTEFNTFDASAVSYLAEHHHVIFNNHYGDLVGMGDFDNLVALAIDPTSWSKPHNELGRLVAGDVSLRGIGIYFNLHSGFFVDDSFFDLDVREFLDCYRAARSEDCLSPDAKHNYLPELEGKNLYVHDHLKYGTQAQLQISRMADLSKLFLRALRRYASSHTPGEVRNLTLSPNLFDLPEELHDYFAPMSLLELMVTVQHQILQLVKENLRGGTMPELPYKDIYTNGNLFRFPTLASNLIGAKFLSDDHIEILLGDIEDDGTIRVDSIVTFQSTEVEDYGTTRVSKGRFTCEALGIDQEGGYVILSYDRANQILDFAAYEATAFSRQAILGDDHESPELPPRNDILAANSEERKFSGLALTWHHTSLSLSDTHSDMIRFPNEDSGDRFFRDFLDSFPRERPPRLAESRIETETMEELYRELLGIDPDARVADGNHTDITRAWIQDLLLSEVLRDLEDDQ